MTELIDINLIEDKYLNKMPKIQNNIKKGIFHKGTNFFYNLQIRNQNHFSFMIDKNKRPYNLLFDVCFNQPFTVTKIFPVSQNGNLFKIDALMSRIHLIKKFFGIDNIYEPLIDPLSGSLYFRIDYFQTKKSYQISQYGQIDSIFRNLNIDKLYHTLQKLVALDYFNQSYGMNDTYFGQKKYYTQLSKVVSLLCDFQNIETFFNEQKQRQKQFELDLNKKQQILQYVHFHGSKKKQLDQTNLKVLKKYAKSLQQQNQILGSLIKRKNGKSNYQPLLVNLNSQKIFKQTMLNMLSQNSSRKSLKVMQSQLGKVTINLQKQQQKTYKLKTKLLSCLPKNTQYHFLDKYFKNQMNVPIMLTLSLKQQSFPRFLETNKLTISMETKIRILLQISSAINTFWEEKNIILYIDNIKKISITKNLTIKIRSLSQYFKVQPHMIFEDKFMVNTKLIDNYLNLSKIYFRLLFNHKLIYTRPSKYKQVEGVMNQFQRSQLIYKNLMAVKILPEAFNYHMKDLLTGLNYVFLSFVDKAEKLATNQKKRRQAKKQVFKLKKTQSSDGDSPIKEPPPQIQNQFNIKLLNYKYTCSWLLKIFQIITQKSKFI